MTVKITLSCDGCHVQDGPHRLPLHWLHILPPVLGGNYCTA
jgi:hypothetical protein